MTMAIDPEIIPSASPDGNNVVADTPRWAIYGAIGLGVLAFVSIVKVILPVILIGLVLGFIWNQAKDC